MDVSSLPRFPGRGGLSDRGIAHRQKWAKFRYHRGVVRTRVLLLLCISLGAACGSDPTPEEIDSPCAAFAKGAKPSVGTEARPALPMANVAAFTVGAGRTYVLGDGAVKLFEDAFAVAIDLPQKSTAFIAAVADDAGTRLYTLDAEQTGADPIERTPRLRRYTSGDGGKTFDVASEKILWSGPQAQGTPGTMAMTASKTGALYVAIGSNGTTPQHGKIFRFDVRRDAMTAPETWMSVTGLPVSLTFDDELGDVWASYVQLGNGADGIFRVRGDLPARTAPLAPIARNDRTDRVPGPGHVYRGKAMPRLVGSYVYSTPSGVGIVEPYGPSGLPFLTFRPAPVGPVVRDRDGELYVVGNGSSLARLVDTAPAIVAPRSLLASKCFDPTAPMGAVAGAIAYDVTTPLWSDGATKERFVVVPKGQSIRTRSDGDLVFPVGTVAVKSFSVDGRRVETRLLVQHDIEDWVGYSYAWNAQGTDAELVDGNRLADVGNGKRWYFPSTSDCGACHTPAAGYTLGLETRQLLGPSQSAALSALDAKTASTVDRATVTPLAPLDAAAATPEARARSYLHSNCSICHREGSVAGSAELDLRFDTPLAQTGLCAEAKAGDFGVTGARVLAPGAPERSVIALRMRATDERRMPKLASRIVDDAGVAAVEAWIKSLSSCP